jgi:pyruvate-formate lyase-activating enzyme
MPNATLLYLAGLTPAEQDGVPIRVTCVDEYVHTDISYLGSLTPQNGERVLVGLVGVQSHQLHRAADLAAYAVRNGCMAVIGGPHPMTCDTSMLQGRGVSFCVAEADVTWTQIISDACAGELAPLYGAGRRWAETLNPPSLRPYSKRDRRRYLKDMQGVYPARGCPKTCNFCSVIQIASRKVRSQPVETTIHSLLAAKTAGVGFLFFTSDNFNKYDGREELLTRMIEEKIDVPWMCQCDTDVLEQPEFVDLLGRAGCYQVFLGVESFDRRVLQAVHKGHNKPAKYCEIVNLLAEHGIGAHFSNIIGFESDTAESIKHHLAELKRVRPLRASFYLLTHIPGSERYAEVLPTGVINEMNLDRFDGTRPTWRHDHLSHQEWLEMFKHCYREFYSLQQVQDTLKWIRTKAPKLKRESMSVAAYSLYARFTAWRGEHPMSGGVWRVRADAVTTYLPLRRRFYGLGDWFPLPAKSDLSEADKAVNRQADDKSWRRAGMSLPPVDSTSSV